MLPKGQFQNSEWVLNNQDGNFRASNQDLTDATYQYYGFLNPGGAWRIIRFHIIASAIIYEYAQGDNYVSYAANWNGSGLYIGTLTFVTFNYL